MQFTAAVHSIKISESKRARRTHLSPAPLTFASSWAITRESFRKKTWTDFQNQIVINNKSLCRPTSNIFFPMTKHKQIDSSRNNMAETKHKLHFSSDNWCQCGMIRRWWLQRHRVKAPTMTYKIPANAAAKEGALNWTKPVCCIVNTMQAQMGKCNACKRSCDSRRKVNLVQFVA